MKTTSANKAFLPDEAHNLIVKPVLANSVATQISEFASISSTEYRIPIVSADPQAEWTAEGAEITPSDATLDELAVTPKKLAGLTIISRELAEDSSPSAAGAVGSGLARDISRKLDAAFFGSSTDATVPEGLEDLVGFNAIDAGATYDSLDAVLQAIADAETAGAVLTSIVTDPATALTFAKLRETSNSIKTLLQPDPTLPTRRVIAGLPLLVSPYVTVGTVWGIPRDRVIVVMRDGTRLEVDRSVYFSSDRVGVKATMRVGFAFPHPEAVQKITLSA